MSRQRRGRRGFTLAEVLFASMLMALLAHLVAQTCIGVVRPTRDLIAHGRIAQEANLAVASLTRDLCGYLANAEGRIGSKALFPLVGRAQLFQSQLWLCFDGGTTPNGFANWWSPDTVISYQLDDGNLTRWDHRNKIGYTVAQHVSDLTVFDLGNGSVQVQITFSYRNVTSTYTFVARDPSS
jgi:prepilin-type N-terminal cleavage/methylation domain-containing protein